jgi:hypothetical protein
MVLSPKLQDTHQDLTHKNPEEVSPFFQALHHGLGRGISIEVLHPFRRIHRGYVEIKGSFNHLKAPWNILGTQGTK